MGPVLKVHRVCRQRKAGIHLGCKRVGIDIILGEVSINVYSQESE